MTDASGIHDDVEAYVLGALDEEERERSERHLGGCASCQREVASYVPVLSALREVPLPPAPPFRAHAKCFTGAAYEDDLGTDLLCCPQR
jgi:anti-sigma factor RsiW